VLSISALSGGDQRYYLSLANINYYTEGGEPPGFWLGQCRHEFGLSGMVEREHLERLCEGFDPHDPEKKLVRNAGVVDDEKKNQVARKPGDDLTFSMPKSASVVWAVAPEDLRKAIEAAHHRAVKRALDYIEDACGWARTGAQGKVVQKAPLLFACFDHSTSRAQDPQLHTHAVAVNITKLEDGKTRAIDSTHFYHHKMSAGALYRCELARGLSELGLPIRQVQHGSSLMFEIHGVPEKLVEFFSKRRAEIEEKLKVEFGSLDAASSIAKEIATLETRRKKEDERPRGELFEKWREIAAEYGLTPEVLAKRIERTRAFVPASEEAREQIFEKAIRDIEESKANFNERDLTRKVAEHGQGYLSCREARELVEEKLRHSERIVNLGDLKTEQRNTELRRYVDRKETQYATPEMIRLEVATHRAAEWLARRASPSAPTLVEEAIRNHPTIKPDQAKAVRYLCGSEGSGNLRLCTGDAGTGKSFMLRVCREVWQKEHRQVIGCALAGAAAESLRESSGIQSDTLHRTLGRIKRGEISLDNRSVVVLDEAGMVGSRLFYRLAREVVRADAKLVAVGDAKQLVPIEAGWIFKRMAQVHKDVRLSTVMRQEVPWQLEAGLKMGHGHSDKALEDYLAHGRLTVSKTRREAVGELVSQWVTDGGITEPRNKLILAGLNADVREINLRCQAARIAAGVVHEEKKVFFDKFFIHEGDRVQFSKRMTKHKIENSWVATVLGVDEARSSLRVRLDQDGRELTLDLRKLPKESLRLGYASSTHKAQGRTVDLAYILAGGPLTSRHLAYVQTTRHRKDARLYFGALDAGPDLLVAARAMKRVEDKTLAVEVIERQRPLEHQQRQNPSRGISLGF
jgi:conjugative relaxase-like TrwC/TraI family protein